LSRMLGKLLAEHLNLAEIHVADGQRIVIEQEQRAEKICRAGHDTVAAENLLNLLREIQSQHEVHQSRILRELAVRALRRVIGGS
jgi:hypothetical protein